MRLFTLALLLCISFSTAAMAENMQPAAAPTTAPAATSTSVFDFTFNALDGKPMPLSAYRGQVLLVVNVASKCGFTKQYAGLQKLWETYRAQGLVVLGVPSNDFGEQEPGTAEDIKRTCQLFAADFPMTAKSVVSGESAHPLYLWAAEQTGVLGQPKWNFHKYLFGRDGQLVDWFSAMTAPQDEKILRAIEAALKNSA